MSAQRLQVQQRRFPPQRLLITWTIWLEQEQFQLANIFFLWFQLDSKVYSATPWRQNANLGPLWGAYEDAILDFAA